MPLTERAIRSWSSHLLALCAFASSAALADSSGPEPGRLLWQHVVDAGRVSATAETVTHRDGKVFVAGVNYAAAPAFVRVRAYEAQTGKLLWSREVSGTQNDEARDLVAFEDLLVFCGILDGIQFGIVAFDLDTGAVIWSDRTVEGGAYSCVGKKDRLYVAGLAYVPDADFYVRAYDAPTGVPLWEDRYDGGVTQADVANALTLDNGKLYVTGWVQETTTSADENMLIRRYGASTGALDWHRVFAGPAGENDEGTHIVVAGDRVIVGGHATREAGKRGATIRAFQASTGKPVWSRFHAHEEVESLAALGGRVLLGTGESHAATQGVLRTYDVQTGRLLWRRSAGVGRSVRGIATDGDTVYWGAGGSGGLLVRAMDIVTGKTVWQRFREAARARDATYADGRLFMVGHTLSSQGTTADYFVRAYSAPRVD